MRELSKSAISFSWAVSLFSAQQLSGVMSPSKTAEGLNAVTDSVKGELDGALQTLFGAGEKLQCELVDLAFGLVPLGAQDPPQPAASSSPGQTSAEAGTQSTPAGRSEAAVNPPSTSPLKNQAGQQQTVGGWNAIPVVRSVSPTAVAPSSEDVRNEPESISPEYPFAPHYVEVFGSRMHYIDEGEGDPILLVHGNATWSYLWRNVIPHLKPYGRCIAPDLIGFGLSDKPNIEYRWIDQARYLDKFVRKLGLKKITLVCNDFGISLGLLYAMRHETEVKGIAFFEGVFKTFKSLEEAYTPDFRPLFKQFRSGEEGGEGYRLLVDQNLFIEQLLPRAAGRELTDEELRRYREPFKQVRSRVPIWRFARSVPIDGEPKDVWATMTQTTEWFKQTTIPKLLFYATPGGLVTAEFVEWARRNLKNLKVVHVGPGVHYLTETSPHVIGRELVQWLKELRGAGN